MRQSKSPSIVRFIRMEHIKDGSGKTFFVDMASLHLSHYFAVVNAQRTATQKPVVCFGLWAGNRLVKPLSSG
jgi:hypothetical protein